jgi:hypothetical protein
MVNSKKAEKVLNDAIDDLEKLEGFELFEDDYDDYEDEDEYEDDYDEYGDLYEGMEDKKGGKKVSKKETEAALADIDNMMKELEEETKNETEGFGNMFNLDFSKNCMILIVIVLILILCKEDIMKMSFFKKIFK